MTQSNQRTDANIDQIAAQWTVRLHLRPLDADEQTELDQWLEANSRHRGALLRARAAWSDLDRLAALAGPRAMGRSSREDLQPKGSAEATPSVGPQFAPHESQGGGEVAYLPPRLFTNRRWFIAAGAASLVLGAVGTWWVRRGEVYMSAVGEVRSVTLSDGSDMVLNTATEATVHFDKVRRQVELAPDGEGLFQVAKDPKRPFIVRAGSVSVRAVGTAFAVRTVNHRVEVTVTEGVVEVMDEVGGVRRVAANERAIVKGAGQVEVQAMPPDEAERRLAWREGILGFAGEPLSTAVEEINRHNTRQIAVDDPILGARPVVGLFRANDPAGFSATVGAALGLQSVEEDGVIHLQQRKGR